LARFLAPDSVGLYGLLAATVGYGVYVVGFEFYAVAARELIGRQHGQWLGILRNQLVFHGCMYALLLPILAIVFAAGLLPWTYLPWLLVLLILEHLSLELNRVLIAASRQLRASALLFVRSGAWCIVVVVLMWRFPQLRTLRCVLWLWMLGTAVACAMGVAQVLLFRDGSRLPRVDWLWIRSSVRLAAPLLVASLAMRGIFTVDRYWVENTQGLALLGVYVLFVGMATAVLAFLDAAVFSFSYPGLIGAAKRGDDAQFRKLVRRLAVEVIVTTALLVGACWVISDPLLRWVGRADYIAHDDLLGVLLLAVALYACSMIPHMALYARGRDRALLYSQLAGFGVFVTSCALLSPVAGLIAVAWAMCLGCCTILVWKLIAYGQMHRELEFKV
jgi:O-antigen/teichoic acid export membrane protein